MSYPVNYDLNKCSSSEYGLTCDSCVNKQDNNSRIPDGLIEILNRLGEGDYILLCHSTKVEEVKSWNLPYKVIGNDWLDKAVGDKDKVYVIPDFNNKPITFRCED